MPEVFISYSRKNSDFIRKLDDALKAAGRDVWVDWQDIARGEDWWRSIQIGIDSSDTALIVITENWLVSEICQRELEYIRQQNKRVFPIVRQRIEGDIALRVKGTWVDQLWEQGARENWKYLGSVNWLFFDDDTTFDAALADLLTALDTDQAYVKNHTRYLVRALEWQQSQRNPSFLLEGDQLSSAKSWLDASAGKTPEPHENHREYVAASSIAATARDVREKARERLIRQSKRATIGLTAVVVIAVIAAVVVGQQFITARAEVTKAAATLEQVNLQVTAAINQQSTAEALVATATIEQGRAVVAQQTSSAREASASTQVAVAGATLSPVPHTLTAVAQAINAAEIQRDIASSLSSANVQLLDNRTVQAMSIVDALVADYPEEAGAYFGRALIQDSLGEYDAAVADYSRAIELDPTYYDAYVNRGLIYMTQGKVEESIANYTRAIEISPDYALSFNNRGYSYAQIGNYDAALADYTTAITMEPDSFDAYFNRGTSYSALSRFDEAIADFNRVLELNSQFVLAYVNRGYIYQLRGNTSGAIADYWSYIHLNETGSGMSRVLTLAEMPYKQNVNIAAGFVYRVPFEARAGDIFSASAIAADVNTLDPVLMLVDVNDQAVTYNDDRTDDVNAVISDFTIPASGEYTLLVSHSAAGSEGELTLTVDLKPTAAPTPNR